ncbi:hypothetical protein BGZ51_005176 [Haplosporangium sp. Z 767]|nr:hypothetical protein BGZ50_007148 [Haplosporangium sp. Z 11]KAF9181781.1 hypothetical protein BGZ51_005176 [Haplosporangium sp. Z 767]
MQASFQPDEERQIVDLEPINYDRIMAHGFPFVPVKRIDVNGPGTDLQGEVETTCVNNGIPIILENWHKHPDWRPELFTFPYIDEHFGELEITCRDLLSGQDIDMSMRDYIRQVHPHSLTSMPQSADCTNVTTPAMTTDSTLTPTNGSTPSPVSAPTTISDGNLVPNHTLEHQDIIPASKAHEPAWASNQGKKLLYAKDVSCPSEWQEYFMHGALFPPLAHMRDNDLNSNTGVAAENLMIYIGQAGTWTPAHVDQCGAIGHNIMTWADNDSSSVWFMVKAEDKEKAEKLWKSFKHPLEYESYFATVEELKQADFPVYVLEQRIGDFVMVPSLSYHQVVNLGRATIKVSWNRLTANCLKAAINVVLPRYREIARPEGYRIKLVIKSTLEAWTNLLQSQHPKLPLPTDQFCQSYKDILDLFRTIVNEDWVDLNIMGQATPRFVKPKRLSHASPACCDFCNSDIWNRQFQCRICLNEDGDPYDLCTNCYALGRGCKHRACSIEFVEVFSMKSCRRIYSDAVRAWNESVDLADFSGFSPITDDWADG